MASIFKFTDKHRTLPWRAKVKGGRTRYFATRDDAQLWASEWERSLRLTGLPPSFEERAKLTVGGLIERYLREVTPTKGSSVSERTVLERLLGINNLKSQRNPICDLTLAQVSSDDAYRYVQDRQHAEFRGKPIKPSTVRREVNILCRIFNVAKKQWHRQLLQTFENPFSALDIKLPEEARERRLRQGELERLLAACEDCRGLNKEYVPIAIFLAIETGMRLQEIFNLRWDDVDVNLGRRTIRITKSKTDHASKLKGRTIVMTVGAMARLTQLQLYLIAHHEYHGADYIFPPTAEGKGRKEAFKQSWTDVVKRAGIADLHFHDLRHEAGSRFDEAGLTHAEHGLMMGHGKRTMYNRYAHAMLTSIRDKLDRHALGDKTHAEHLATILEAQCPPEFEETKAKLEALLNPQRNPLACVDRLRQMYELLGIGRVNLPSDL